MHDRGLGSLNWPRRAAIQERTRECVSEVMAEGIVPCGGPGGDLMATARCAKAATPEGCNSADSRKHDCGHD